MTKDFNIKVTDENEVTVKNLLYSAKLLAIKTEETHFTVSGVTNEGVKITVKVSLDTDIE